MVEPANAFEVFDPVVELIVVDVVDVVSCWHFSVVLFPDVDVLHDVSAVAVDPVVSFCCDCHSSHSQLFL